MSRKQIMLTDESGQTMAEYAIVLSVIILVACASLTLFGEAVESGFAGLVDIVKSAT